MSMLLHDCPDRVLPIAERSLSSFLSAVATEPLANPGASPLRSARSLAHRPDPGCSCGCTFDALTHRCIEPWNPPAGGNDLGPLFFG